MSCAMWKIRLLAMVLAVAATAANAQPPDRLASYRFLPRYSILNVTGGFAGLDIDANIHGTFDFITGYRHDFPHLHRYAAFANVDAEAINPTDFGPYSFDIDQSLNLSGLEGRPGLLPIPLESWVFRGLDGQRAPISIHAVEVGPWLAMFGRNAPPPNTADLFNYHIKAIARRVPFADFNHDDAVDRHDLGHWGRRFGEADHASVNSESMGGDEFLLWQQQVGETMPDLDAIEAAVNAASSVAAVPEPTGAVLLACGMLMMMRSRSVRPELT